MGEGTSLIPQRLDRIYRSRLIRFETYRKRTQHKRYDASSDKGNHAGGDSKGIAA